MATNYPSSLDTSSEQPSPSSTTDLDATGYEHDVVHTNHSGAIIALETKLGTTDSNATANAVLMGTGSGTSAWDTSPTFKGAVTVGVDDTGHDVKFFGGTSDSYFLWDESADQLIIRQQSSGNGLDTGLVLQSHQTSDVDLVIGDGIGIDFWIPSDDSPDTFHTATIAASKTSDTDANEGTRLEFQTTENGGSIGTRMVIDDTGNVGIGTTTPMRELDVWSEVLIHHGDDAWLWQNAGSDELRLWFQDSYTSGDSGWGQQLNIDSTGNLTVYGNIVPDSNDTHDLGADGTEWNNLWIDVVKCTNEIQLGNGSSSDPSLTFTSDGDTGIYRKAANTVGITAGSAVHYFDTNGLTLASGDYLRTYGSSGWYNVTYGTGLYSADTTWVKTYDSGTGLLSQGGMAAALSGISSTSGYQYVMRGTVYTNFAYYTSMRDSKDKITNFTDSGVIVDALNPVTFVEAAPESETDAEKAWREADLQYGFVAEEICENDVTSHLGQYDGEMNAVGWKWQDTIAVLTTEVKSLRARVATLEGS